MASPQPLMEALKLSIEDICFAYENSIVRLIAARDIPRIETAGLVIEETTANKELRVNLWVAWELVEAGLARFADGGLKPDELIQAHYRERLQPLGQLSSLPDRFYTRAYITFNQLTREAKGEEARLAHLNRLKGMFRDILESRINKIVKMASSEVTSPPRELQPEETRLFEELNWRISAWRRMLRKVGER